MTTQANPRLPSVYEREESENTHMILLTLTEEKRRHLMKVLADAQQAHAWKTEPLMKNPNTHESVRAYLSDIASAIADVQDQLSCAPMIEQDIKARNVLNGEDR
jgi:hypothetical protein